ncbi:hypothetical protein MRY82_04770 [bacterium]|nr:hypothetical protein [bacterium]
MKSTKEIYTNLLKNISAYDKLDDIKRLSPITKIIKTEEQKKKEAFLKHLAS